MDKVLRGVLALPALLFLVSGLRWAVDPAGAAAGLGMTLLEAPGLGSQIGDVGGLFLSMGLMIGLALMTRNAVWFRAPAIMLLAVAVLRIVAALVHDAGFAPEAVAVEVIVASLLLFASNRIAVRQP